MPGLSIERVLLQAAAISSSPLQAHDPCGRETADDWCVSFRPAQCRKQAKAGETHTSLRFSDLTPSTLELRCRILAKHGKDRVGEGGVGWVEGVLRRRSADSGYRRSQGKDEGAGRLALGMQGEVEGAIELFDHS